MGSRCYRLSGCAGRRKRGTLAKELTRRRLREEGVFHWVMGICEVTPPLLNSGYSYVSGPDRAIRSTLAISLSAPAFFVPPGLELE